MMMTMMMVMVMMKITMMIVMVSKPSTTKKSLQLGQDFWIRVLPMTENKRIFSLSNPFYLHVSISISQAKWCAHGSILGYRLILKTWKWIVNCHVSCSDDDGVHSDDDDDDDDDGDGYGDDDDYDDYSDSFKDFYHINKAKRPIMRPRLHASYD